MPTQGDGWLKQAGREIPILVLGILIAFGLQAWWDEAQERSDAEQAIVALRSELQLNERELRAYISRHERVGTATQALRGRLEEGGPRVQVPDSLLIAVLVSPTFDAATGAIDSLQRSGKGSSVLAAAMAEWSALKTDAAGEEDRSRRFTDDRLSQYLSRNVDLPPADLAPDWVYERLRSPIEGTTLVTGTSELLFLLGTRIKLANLCSLELGEVLASTRALLALVEAELD